MQVWPEFSTSDTINSTAAMFLKEETIIQEKEITTTIGTPKEVCTTGKMLNAKVEQDVIQEIWPEFPANATGNTLNTRAAIFIKEEMITQEEITNIETCVEEFDTNGKMFNANVEQDVKIKLRLQFPTNTTGDTLNTTAAIFIKEEMIKQEEITNIKTCVEEYDTNEKMLNAKVEQDEQIELWPELPRNATSNTLNNTDPMFIKEEMIKQEAITNITTCVEELYPNGTMLNDEVEQDVKMEVWPEFPTITTVETLNSTTETPMIQKEQTIIQELGNTSEKKITNFENCLESSTLTRTATDKAIGIENHEEIIVNGTHKVKCKECGRFYRKDYITRHLRVHTGERPYICLICGKTFKESTTKTTHEQQHIDQHDFSCTVCGKSYIHSAQFRKHARKHTGEVPVYECKVCGKKFLRSHNLKDHLNIHSDKRPFACENCGKCFSSKHRLGKHMVSHWEEKKYECHFCGTRFAHQCTMNTHLSRHCKGRS